MKIKNLLNQKGFACRQAGFSLAEVVIVTAIAGMIILVLANIPNAVKLIGASQNESVAKQIAAKKVEDVRSSGYDNLSNNTPNGVTFTDTRLSDLPLSSGKLLIEDCPSNICTNGELIKKVTISINWSENTKAKTYQISTFVAQGGLR